MAKNSTTNRIIKHILPTVKNTIVCDKLIFVESKKYNNKGLPKSLYLIFTVHQNKSNKIQKVTYEISRQSLEYCLHVDFLKPLK